VGTILKYHTVGTILKYHTVGTILKYHLYNLSFSKRTLIKYTYVQNWLLGLCLESKHHFYNVFDNYDGKAQILELVQYNDQQKKDKTLRSKLEMTYHKPHQKLGVNSGAQEGVLFLLHKCYPSCYSCCKPVITSCQGV
jgi:hypothetical protein